MNLLFVGDVIGAPGRRALVDALLASIDRHRVDFTIVNIENAAGGFGLTVELFEELSKMPIDVFSSGNHIWDKKEIYDALNASDRLLRPANYPPGQPGTGLDRPEDGRRHPGRRPEPPGPGLHAGQRRLALPRRGRGARPGRRRQGHRRRHPRRGHVRKGRARLVPRRPRLCGHRHPHPRADRRRDDPSGRNGVPLRRRDDGSLRGDHRVHEDRIIEKFLSQTPRAFETAKRDIRLSGAVVDVDEATGKARRIERVQVKVD